MRKIAAFVRVVSPCLFLCMQFAWSADVPVTSDADSGPNTLRAALATANNGDTIVFALPAGSTITLASTLTVTNNVVIDGAGSSGLTLDGNHAVVVLTINNTATATISNLTIANGTNGISSLGTLTVSRCMVRGSTTGISSYGTLLVANSTISGNSTPTVGGGIKLNAGSATIANNTFVYNAAHYGGAIESNSTSPSTVTNNLFQGNSATQFGASVYDLENKISADHNLYWNNPDQSGPGCYQCASDTNAILADPLLDALADHGGPTQTHFPYPGSAAIDSGDDATCAAVNNLDQRGVARPVGAHCDIGSVESNDPIFADAFDPPVVYSTGFETCPDGWTLTGDWQCGVPQNVGPATAFEGTQSLGTQIAANYSDLQTWAATTATSPDIDLTGLTNPTATFRMWVDTEGSTYDGADLMISTDGGAIYTVVASVTPAYPLTIGGNPAWGGHQGVLGWQLVEVDLSAYAGTTVRLRFAFQSDSSGTFAGFYVDDFSVQ